MHDARRTLRTNTVCEYSRPREAELSLQSKFDPCFGQIWLRGESQFAETKFDVRVFKISTEYVSNKRGSSEPGWRVFVSELNAVPCSPKVKENLRFLLENIISVHREKREAGQRRQIRSRRGGSRRGGSKGGVGPGGTRKGSRRGGSRGGVGPGGVGPGGVGPGGVGPGGVGPGVRVGPDPGGSPGSPEEG